MFTFSRIFSWIMLALLFAPVITALWNAPHGMAMNLMAGFWVGALLVLWGAIPVAVVMLLFRLAFRAS